MFKKDDNSFSILDNAVEISCEKLTCKNIDILGKVSGFVSAKNIFVKNNGNVTGKIHCQESLKIEKGSVEGEIMTNYIYLYKGGILKGKIRYINLHIEEGATIESDDIKKITQDEIDNLFKLENAFSNEV